jgi:hypothetical protein
MGSCFRRDDISKGLIAAAHSHGRTTNPPLRRELPGSYLSPNTSPNSTQDLPSNRAIWIWRIGVTFFGST